MPFSRGYRLLFVGTWTLVDRRNIEIPSLDRSLSFHTVAVFCLSPSFFFPPWFFLFFSKFFGGQIYYFPFPFPLSMR